MQSISNGVESLLCNKEIQEDDYLTLPSKLKLLKSSSSSTLSRTLNSQTTDDKVTNSNRLRKSKSVVDRTEASPLFGRYSISKNNKLQVDHSSQTDDDLLKTSAVSPEIVAPSCVRSSQRDTLLEGATTPTLDIPEETDHTSNSAMSSSKSSVQSSETSSPSSSFAVYHKGHLSLPNSMANAFLGHEEGEISDTESLASIDVLTDDQISSLMIDKELEDAAQNLKLNEQDRKIEKVKQQNLHQTTQTYVQY